jgi:hypothetical protein
MLETFSICLHAHSKVGKSTFGGSALWPKLIIDAEGSTKFLPLRFRQWDPWKYAPPVADGTWDAARVTVRTIKDLHKVNDVLQLGQHQFNSVVIDSISEIQRKLKDGLRGTDGWEFWEQILTQMDYLLRQIRDLQDHPTRPVPMTVFISETMAGKAGKLVPNIQGKMGTILPYLFDIIGYLEDAIVRGPDGQPMFDMATGQYKTSRIIHIKQGPQFEAGERVQGRFGTHIDVPEIDMINDPKPSTLLTDMYFHLYPHMRPQAQGAMQQ